MRHTLKPGGHSISLDPPCQNRAEAELCAQRRQRIALLTDGAPGEEIPAEVRQASDWIIADGVSLLERNAVPEGFDGAILWTKGDQLLEGAAADLRHAVHSHGRALVPVHLPCLPELDLVGLQPRVWTSGSRADTIASTVRIAGSVSPSPEFCSVVENSAEPWARIYQALLLAQSAPERASSELFKLWEEASVLLPVFRALLLSNMMVLAIRAVEVDLAGKLARLAMDYFPRSADLAFLAGWIASKQDNFKAARRYAEQAIESGDEAYVGRGGERSYRSEWLLGVTFELEGQQASAVKYYSSGAARYPAFAPAVLGLLRQRLSFEHARELSSNVLLSLVEREPQYLELVLHFLLLHRQFDPARRLLDSSGGPGDIREKLQWLLGDAAPASPPPARSRGAKPSVLLIGPFLSHSDVARTNRELAAGLMSSGEFDVALEPDDYGDTPGNQFKQFSAILQGYKARPSRLDVMIRHCWPPDVERAPGGRVVCISPWQYGAVPRLRADEMGPNADEVWVPSQFVKEALVGAGIRAARVHVIPSGIDTETFRPDGPSWRPEGCRRLVFLFLGPSVPHRGPDVLWKAYSRAFTLDDDVTLILKDRALRDSDSRQSLSDAILASTRVPRSPHLVILREDCDDAKLAELYRGSNAFVLPYRSSGFGMPLAEALACGKPVITTGLGPAREFCPPEASYFIPAVISELTSSENVFGRETPAGTWFEPDVKELARMMRHVYEHPDEAARKGELGAETIRTALDWKRICQMQIERIRKLTTES